MAIRLVPRDQELEPKAGIRLIPREERLKPKPYPTEPSLFGVTPGRDLPSFEPQPRPGLIERGKEFITDFRRQGRIAQMRGPTVPETPLEEMIAFEAPEWAFEGEKGPPTEPTTEFVTSVTRAAARKLKPPALDWELAAKRDTATGLYRGGEPIPHEELVDHFVNPQAHGTQWTPMGREEAEQFIKDEQNLEFVENLTWVAIIGVAAFQGIRALPAAFREIKGDFSRIFWKENPMPIIQRLQKLGISRERWSEIMRGRGKPATDEELSKLQELRSMTQKSLRRPFEWLRARVQRAKVAPEPAVKPTPEPAGKPITGKELILRPKPPPEKPKVAPRAKVVEEARVEEAPKPRTKAELAAAARRMQAEVERKAAEIRAKPGKPIPGAEAKELRERLGKKPDAWKTRPHPSTMSAEAVNQERKILRSQLPKLKGEERINTLERLRELQPDTPTGRFRAGELQAKIDKTKIRMKKPTSPKAKEPWEMTLDEWKKIQAKKFIMESPEISHKRFIQQAIKAKKSIPPEVLADYPDLKPKPEGEVWPGKEPERRPPRPITKRDQKEIKASRQAILKYAEKHLKVPIRIGRFRRRAAAGIYKVKPKVIRLKKALDVEVAAHEIGHHIQKLLGFRGKGRIPAEVQALAYPGAKNKSQEGFAEFVRFYMTDEAQARQKAPKFYEEFDGRLYDFPDVRNAIIQIKQTWKEWRQLPSQDKVGSIIESGKRGRRLPTISELYRQIVDEITPLEHLKKVAEENIKTPFKPSEDPFMLAWLTRGWARKAENFLRYGTFQVKEKGIQFTGPSLREILKPIEDAGERHLLDRYLVAKRAVSDPRILRAFAGIIEKGDLEQTVKELEPKYKEVAESLYAYQDQLLQYLEDSGRIAPETRKAIKKKNLFYAPFYRFMDVDEPALGLSRKKFANLFQPIKRLKGSSRVIISPTESILKNTYAIINAAERNRVGEALIKLAKIEGMGFLIEKLPVKIKPVMIPTSQLEQILKKYGRWKETVFHEEISKELGETIKQMEGKTPTEKVENLVREALERRGWSEGESKQIIERLKTAKTDAERKEITEKIIEKTTITTIMREYGFDISDPAVAVFKPNYACKPNEVILFDKGEAKVYQLDPELYRALTAMDADSLNILIRMFSYPAKWLRAGAVQFSPEFAARNPARDQMTAFVYSQYGFKPGYDLIRGLYHIFRADHVWQQFNAGGAAHAAMVSVDRDYVHKSLKDMIGKPTYRELMTGRGIHKLAKHPLEMLQVMNELMEEGTRVGEFARGLQKEGQNLDAVLRAARAARDVTLDFSRIGNKMRAYNAITAFQNAGIQGIDKMRRAFTANPWKATLRAFLGLSLPTILLWWAQKDDPAYQELPYWRKILCWNIITHNPDGTVKRIWSIPKPFELGVIFGSIPEAALDWAYQKDPQSFKETMKQLGKALNPGLIPTVLIPIMEWFANRSWFFDRPIVPRGREELSPELQYRPRTPESVKLLAKGMVKIPGLKEVASPAKITNLIRGYTGAAGYLTLQGIDQLLEKAGIVETPIAPERRISDLPGFRAFTHRFPSGASRSIEDFYRKYNKMRTEWESAKQRVGIRGFGVKVRRPLELEAFEKTNQGLKSLRKVVDIIYKSDLSAKEKRDHLNILYLSMINVARAQLGRKPIKKPRYPWQKEVVNQ